MSSNYLSRPELEESAVERASRACGDLRRWLGAQVKYLETLSRMGPLEREIAALNDTLKRQKDEYAAAMTEVSLLVLVCALDS